jgi:hypothetical protein
VRRKKMKYSSITRIPGSPSVEECLKDVLDILGTINRVVYSCLYNVLAIYKIDLKKTANRKELIQYASPS